MIPVFHLAGSSTQHILPRHRMRRHSRQIMTDFRRLSRKLKSEFQPKYFNVTVTVLDFRKEQGALGYINPRRYRHTDNKKWQPSFHFRGGNIVAINSRNQHTPYDQDHTFLHEIGHALFSHSRFAHSVRMAWLLDNVSARREMASPTNNARWLRYFAKGYPRIVRPRHRFIARFTSGTPFYIYRKETQGLREAMAEAYALISEGARPSGARPSGARPSNLFEQHFPRLMVAMRRLLWRRSKH